MQQAPDGVQLRLEVSAGAKEARFPAGYNEWRERIGIRVHAPAQEGRANQEVREMAFAFFDVARADVVLVAGLTDARKTLLLRGSVRDDALARLAVVL